jgi:hypothetical protein
MFSLFKYLRPTDTIEKQIERCEAILVADPADLIAHEILATLHWEGHDFERAFIHGEQASMASDAAQKTVLIAAASAFKIGKMPEAKRLAELALARAHQDLSGQIFSFTRMLSRVPLLKKKMEQLEEDAKIGDVHYAELRAWAEEFVSNKQA